MRYTEYTVWGYIVSQKESFVWNIAITAKIIGRRRAGKRN